MDMKKEKVLALFVLSILVLSVFCACGKKQTGNTTEHRPGEETSSAGNRPGSGNGGDSEGNSSAEDLPDVVFLEKLNYAHITGAAIENIPDQPGDDAEYSISIRYLYRGENPKVSFVKFDDPKADAAFTGLELRPEQEEFYKGYRYGEMDLCFDFSKMESGQDISIGAVTLSVNGREQILDTAGRIMLSRMSKEEEEYQDNRLTWAVNPDAANQLIPVGAQFPVEKKFEFTVQRTATIEKLEFGDWLRITKAIVYVDGVERGSMEDVFPLKLFPKQTLRITAWLLPDRDGTEPEDGLSGYNTDMSLFYHADNKEQQMRTMVYTGSQTGVAFQELMAMWIDNLVAPPNSAGTGEDLIFLTDYVYHDRTITEADKSERNKFTFRIPILYQDHLPYIRLKGTDDVVVDAISKEVKTVSVLGIKAYKDWKLGELSVSLNLSEAEPGTKFDIHQMYLLVDGVEQTLDTAGHFCYYKAKDGEFGRMNGDVFFNREIGEGMMVTEKTFSETTVVNKLEIAGSFSPENTILELNGKAIGKTGDVLPLTVSSGDTLTIRADKNYWSVSPYAEVKYNVFLYTIRQDGNEEILSAWQHNVWLDTRINEEEEWQPRYQELVDHVLEERQK